MITVIGYLQLFCAAFICVNIYETFPQNDSEYFLPNRDPM